jgi:uncharacterized protein
MRKLMLVAVSVMLAAPVQMVRAAQTAQNSATPASNAQAASAQPAPGASAGATGQSATQVADTQTPKIDPAKEADIRRLLDLTGAAALTQQVMTSMEHDMKPLLTNALPPGDYRDQLIELFWQKFQSKMNTDSLLNLAITRYDENFSDDEIKQLINFYQSPLGEKVVTVLPKLTQELQQDGGKMGQQLGRESMLEVLQEHPELARQLQEAAQHRGAQTQP